MSGSVSTGVFFRPNRVFWTFFLMLIGGFSGLLAAIPPHLVLASRLVDAVRPENNDYASRPTRVVFPAPGVEAINRSVCSTFLTALLKEAYGLKDSDIKGWFGEVFPEADDIFLQVDRQNRFKKIGVVGEILAGDIIVVNYRKQEVPTGHVMIVAAAPKIWRKEKKGGDSWKVEVIDSSSSFHGVSDTRCHGSMPVQGLGRGTVVLLVNAEGIVEGYWWSDASGSVFHSVQERPLLIGRIRLEN